MTPVSRRTFLQASALGAAAVGMPRAAGAPAGSPFAHGVASGDPLPDRVVLWTRVTPREPEPVGVRWLVATDPELTDVVAEGRTVAAPERDWTVKVDPGGLHPATTYYYAFAAYGRQLSPVGRTRTLPAAGVERARLALVSCSNYSSGYFNAYRAMAARDLDVWLHVGDWFYEGAGNNALGRRHVPPRETVSLADYRTRHAQYRTDADLQELSRQHPLICVWDDHESTNNSWRDGAGNHQPASEGDWGQRKLASVRAYDEWMPIRLPDPDDPLTIWRRFAFGDLLDLFMLDTRLQRNAPETSEGIEGAASRSADRTALGERQREWLLDGLVTSTARWRVLGQQIKFAPHRNLPTQVPLPYLPPEVVESLGIRQGGGQEGTDNWGAYAHERDSIIRTLRDEGVANNVVLVGDIHTAWASDVTEDPITPYNELTAEQTGAPGYDPLTGRGSVAVELTCPSVTSHNLAEVDGGRQAAVAANAAVVAGNPNVMHHDIATHGFVLLDITRDRVQGEFWDVGDVRQPFGAGDDAVLTSSWQAVHGEPGAAGTDHLVPGEGATPPRSGAPRPAPPVHR